jgi:hypothetical protein
MAYIAFLLLAAAAQTVHTVDDTPGTRADFGDIQSAVLSAVGGDTILVYDGTYASFVLDGKDLAVVGENPGTVQVVGTSRVEHVGPAQEVLLHNLDLVGQDAEALIVDQAAGRLWIQECSLASQNGAGSGETALVLDGATDVRLLRSEVQGGSGAGGLGGWSGGAGLDARASSLQVFDSTVSAGDGGDAAPFGFDGGDGGDAVVLDHVALRAWYSSFSAGDGGYADYCESCPGGLVCLEPGSGGTALIVSNPPPAPSIELLLTALIPGAAGPGAKPPGREPCPDGQPGSPSSGTAPGDVVSLFQPQRSLWVPSPVRDGGAGEIYLQALQGELVLVAVGAPSAPLALPGLLGALFLDPGPGFQIVFAGPFDPARMPLLPPIPQQPPGFETVRLFLQGAAFSIFGSIQLLSPSSVVVIDDGI